MRGVRVDDVNWIAQMLQRIREGAQNQSGTDPDHPALRTAKHDLQCTSSSRTSEFKLCAGDSWRQSRIGLDLPI